MKQFLNRHIDTIFIMLGNECNLSCRYCLQHPLVEHPIAHTINPDIYDFIENVCGELPEEGTLRLQFFGGEPLLFFGNIQTIVEETKRRKLPVSYSCMTNGKLISQEMVDFFNENKFLVCVSWDGFNTVKTRGFDPFAAGSKQRGLLLQIENLGVSAVLSTQAYPMEICRAFQLLDNAYYPKHSHHIYMNVDDIMDTGNIPQDLTDFDYTRLKKEISELTAEYFDEREKGEVPADKYARNVYIHEKYVCLKNFYQRKSCGYGGYTCCCGNGYTTYNLGLDGTLFPCHNTSESAGTIYGSYMKYLTNIIKTDTTKERRDVCKDCFAISYCHGGCKMIGSEARERQYCKLKRAVFEPILDYVTELGRKLVSGHGG